MRRAIPTSALLLAVLLSGCIADTPSTHSPTVFAFDGDTVGAAPTGFTPGGSEEGGPARWVVVADETAPSGDRVLEQSDAHGEDPRFAVILADDPVARDVRVSVRVKPLTGDLDRSGGVVFRATSGDTYYVARANLLEKNVRLYHCVGGIRTQIASWERRLAAGRWHTLEAEAQGDHIVVRWDGDLVIDVHDTTLDAAGRAGVWTKADAVSRFDDLRITPLD